MALGWTLDNAMPTVPISPQVAQTQMQVQRASMPDVNVTAGRQAMQSGEALLRASQGLDVIADHLAEAKAKEYDNKLAEAFRVMLNDPQSGYLNTVGKTAVEGRDGVMKSIRETAQKMGDGAGVQGSDMFKRVAERRLQMASQQIDVHASTQVKAYNIGQTTARIKNSAADAVANLGTWEDPQGGYTASKKTMLEELDALAQMNGLGDDQKKLFRMDALTGLHAEAVNTMIANGKTGSAKKYLDKNAQDIDPSKMDNLQKLVHQSNINDESLRLSMSLKGGLGEQLSSVDTLFKSGKIDADLYDKTRTRIEHNWQTRKAQEAEGDKSAMGAFQDWIIKNPGKTVLDAPPQLYQWAKNRGHLSGLDGFAQREGRSGDKQTELQVRGGLLQTAIQDPDAFISEFKRTAFSDRLDLGSAGIKEMQNIANDMMRGNGKYSSPFNQKIIDAAIPSGLDKAKKPAFVALMVEAGDRWKKANPGKHPDQRAYEQMAAEANQEWISIGSLWNTGKKAYEVRTDKDENAVPAEFYKRLKQKGASEDEIKKAWLIQKGAK